ncbi:GNAT family N-acetyltransferase [Sulfurimonas sp. MAG313]|nr:GNAT family N-acetyltransferase [Sulfurimonas sp. MAG313]MDF1880222.1 GNAT family N-acetyltransferase [Sulfurimonas sp. MAG313]
MNQELYFLRSSEQYLAKELLYYAARLDEGDTRLEDFPLLEQYERNYGSYNGDIGVYIMVEGKVAGGAWVRILANGFGYVDDNTPELVFAVKPEFRNQGIGTAIMQQLFIEVSKSFSQISLSVRETNPVISLYERLGFTKVEGTEHKNPAGTLSFTMIKHLDEFKQAQEVKHLEEECFRKSFS